MSFVPTVTNNDTQDEREGQDDEGPRFRMQNAILGKKENKDEEEDEGEDEDEDVDEDDDQDRGHDSGPGLGFQISAPRPSSPGDGKRQHSAGLGPDLSQAATQIFFDGTNALGSGFVPSSAKAPVLREEVDSTPSRPKRPQPSAFGKNGKTNSKSFGARMMAKMGFVEGMGLGKEGQGRNVIIEANLRPMGVGLGSVKEKSEQERQEEKRQARLRGEEMVDSDEEEKKRRKEKKKALRATGDGAGAGGSRRRQRTKYLTAEELKASAPGLHIPDAFTPILDMTGPTGRKVVTSIGSAVAATADKEQATAVTEASKLVKRAQADLLAFSDEWRSLEERKSWTDVQLKERQEEISDLESDFQRLQSFYSLVSRQLKADSDWNDVMACFELANRAGLSAGGRETAEIAVAAIDPLLKSADWDPLAEPEQFALELRSISGLLMKQEAGREEESVDRWKPTSGKAAGVFRRHQKASTAYESMMYKSWLPRVLAATRIWDVSRPGPMLRLVEAWRELLPGFVWAQLIDNIGRRLETALSEWSPKRSREEEALPHNWLFPWLPHLPGYHLDPRSTGLVAEVRRKYRHLMEKWDYERGVIPGLRQWKDVLGDQWRPLIMSHLLPSMGRYLGAKFRVDPADQEPYLPVLMGVLGWHEVLGTEVLGQMLAQHLFPMWRAKLEEWLALAEVDLEEVADWYSWWRGALLKELAGGEGVGRELDKGMQMMNLV